MTKEQSNPQPTRKRSEMSDAERVQDFQRKLYQKAKQEKEFRFYVLYDKITLPHVLREAYKQAKANGGAPGVDGKTFAMIEAEGVGAFLESMKKELEAREYKPAAVRRVMIPKANGKLRPLGIPTIKDRVVQTACKMVIEPIFEADFEESSYGFRPKRSPADAMKSIKKNLQEGRTEVFDADLSSYFDTIPHDKLLKTVSLRISDPRVIHLLKLWLKAPISEEGKISGGKKNKVGTPQGGVISPLLANVYLHLLDRIVNSAQSAYRQQGIKIVRYADDFVLMGKRIPESIIEKTESILTRMGLSLNKEKTKVVQTTTDHLEFLGFQVRYDQDIYGREKRYWNIVPSPKSCKKLRQNLSDYLKKSGHVRPTQLAREMNAKLRGWLNYFSIPKVSYPQMAKRKLRWYLSERLMRFYRRKSQRRNALYCQRAFQVLVTKYGLIDPWEY